MKMQKKRILSLIAAAALLIGMLPTAALPVLAADETPKPIFEDTSYSFEERAADLIARMSVAQKGSQLISQGSSAIAATQLGGGALNVPATKGVSQYTWWSEALHGYSNGTGASNATSYPQSLTAGSTWNPELYYREAAQISDEIRERTSTNSLGNAINLTFYSPTVNMERDPRWGRNEESYSEDVYLDSKMGTQFVLGMEGKNQDGTLIDPNGYYKLVSTVKHYTANNSEHNRLNGGATTDLRALREYYTAPYRNIIRNAGVSSVMTAYSTVNGEPCTYSSYLMDTLLRQTFGFDGYITSDCDATSSVYRQNYKDPYTSATPTAVEQYSIALAHGDDLECNGGYDSNRNNNSYKTLAESMVSQGVTTDMGKFTENTIDVALERLMTARIKTGEFDDNLALTAAATARKTAYGSASGANQTADRLAIAEQVAEEGVVLLKNSGSVLPLAIPASGKYNVVIVGSWQTNMYLGLYSTSVSTNTINIQKGITDAIKAKDADATVTYITSNTLTDANKTAISAADAVIVVAGTSSSYSAEDVDRTTNALPDNQAALISTVGKLNPKTVAIMETCGPMQVNTFENDVAAILWSSFGGIHKGVGFGKVITGEVNPSGKLTATWYQNVSNSGTSDIPGIDNYNLYHNATDSGRTYMYYQGETPVSYPFGYGLSYSTFAYSNLKLDADSYTADGTITATFDVQNTGTVAGKEIAELYIAQPDAAADLNRPIRRLEGFEKVELAAGEKKTLTMKVKIADLAFFNADQDKYVVDTGRYQVMVGGSSATSALTNTADLTVTGTLTAVPSVLTAKPNQTGDTAKGIEQRVIFDKGVTVNPQLTVAMNDESLYGHIIAQSSSPIKKEVTRAFPEGTTVTYTSNRPSVVSVGAGNVITTVAPGVATITAKLTYNGKSASTDFVVYVESSPYLEDIKVGGTSISGFQSKTFNYSVTLGSLTTVPEITTVSSNPSLTVAVSKPASLPGTAVITTTNADNGETATYYVGLGTAPVSTDFRQGSSVVLGKGWHVLNANEDHAAWNDTDGLSIITAQGAFSADATPENVYLESAFGNWVAQTEVKFDATPTVSNQQAGLIVYNDNLNYLRFVYEHPTSGTSNVIRAYKCVNGTESQVGSATAASLTALRMQIIKQGSVYTFKYSTDGTAWTAFSTTANVVFNCPQVGVLADNGSVADAAAVHASFAQLLIIPVEDLYPRLTGITFDGAAFSSFAPDTLTYNVEVADDAATVPVIAATAKDGYTVSVTQPTAVTGTATITVSSQAANTTYTINFGYGPKSDYFADGAYSDRWTILKPDAAAYTVEKGKGIVLPTQRYDIYSTGGAWKNCFVTPAMGNAWEAVAKVVYPVKPNANYQQAMFLVWQDEDNYIRLNCQQSSLKVEPGVETNGSFSGGGFSTPNATAAADGTVTLYFKIAKNGTTYYLAYSQDGLAYTDLGSVKNINYNSPKLGLFASMNNSGTAIKANFEYMTVTNKNGVEAVTKTQMLENATQNVLDYVKADIGTSVAETAKQLTIDAVPHGYTLEIVSDNTAVITNSGAITHDETDAKTANLTITVTDTLASTPIVKTAVVAVSVPAYKIVKNLTADIAAGTYTDTQTVKLASATSGVSIFYTTDGSTPSADHGTAYTDAGITVDDTMVVKAVGVKEGYVSSDVLSLDYKIYESKLAKPTISPKAGIITAAETVSLSAAEGAAIHYTVDGTAPTAQSPVYSGPITVDKTMAIKAIATQSRKEPSDVAVFSFFLTTSTGADDATDSGNSGGRTDLSLAKEYEDYFRMGTFGNYNSGDWEYQGNVSSPANDLKLVGQIGSSNTSSKSRQTYTAAVAAINADTTMTDEEKAAAIKKADENVVLDSSSQQSGISALNAIRAWNEAHPDNPRKVRAHCLSWHGGQQPNYFFCEGFVYDSSKTLAEQAAPKDVMLARLDNYIHEMMDFYAQYKDIIVAWDVTNEAIDDYSGQIRNSGDYQVGQWGTVFRTSGLDNIVKEADFTLPDGITFTDVGDQRLYEESAWVRQAFASARKWSDANDCHWKLYYNDFQDSNKPYEPKMSQTIKMLSWIPDNDIDGYGLQGRLSYAYPSIAMIKNQIDRALAETGCDEISFTESDIRSDFITNPAYNPDEPSTRVVASDPQWPDAGSGSYSNISSVNGNTFDVTNSPVKRDPAWGTGGNNDLANSAAKMTAQADYAADLMDLLIGYAKNGQVGVYQWDGSSDSSTFNSNTGCTLWNNSGSPKYSYYAVAGAPARAKMNDVIASGPSDSQESKYTEDSWQAYQAAKQIAEDLVDVRIYNLTGINKVKMATNVLAQTIKDLVKVTPGSVSFLTKGNAGSFQILNQASSKIVEGKGLLLTNTRGTIMSDSNVDDSSNLNNPKDLVITRANGDWTATIKIRDLSSGPWYYGYVCFLAMQDYDNHVGFLAGDSSVDVKLEKDGVQTNIVANSSYKISTTPYLRIVKSGDDYTFFVSSDCSTWNQIAEVKDTGLTDVNLAIDSYGSKSITQTKTMYVEYVHVMDAENTESTPQFALRKAAEYTASKMGTLVMFPAGSKTVKLGTLSGYTTTFVADNTNIVASDGTVTAPADTTVVPVRIKVSDGVNDYTSDPINLTISGMSYKIESVAFNQSTLADVDGDLRATVAISNTGTTAQNTLMVVALYNPDGQMVDYSSVGKAVQPGQRENFEAGFRVPFAKGSYEGYTAKVFVWDGTSMSNTNGLPLSIATILQ